MHIELNDQEESLARQGEPVMIVDPHTKQEYTLIAREKFDQVRSFLNAVPRSDGSLSNGPGIPEGIRLSREAFRRELPNMLRNTALFHQWAAYNRDRQIAIGPSQRALVLDCFKSGLPEDEFYVGWIDASELEIEEEVELRLHHFEE